MRDISASTADSGEAVVLSRTVGPFDVVALRDASGPFFMSRQAAFPDATGTDWDRAQEVDPGAFGAGDVWNLDFRCFAIRRPGGRTTVVDTGVGPDGSPASGWAPMPGHLPEVLVAAGIDTAEVDTVVMTHLHEDHIGWTVLPDGQPMFGNARYVVQRREIDALVAADDQTLLRYVVEPLRSGGHLHEVDGRVQLNGTGTGGGDSRTGGGVTAIPTPGHTPGHQSVLVESGAGRIVITGDVLVHAVQLVNPEVSYRFESDRDLARHSRRVLLDRARGERVVLATAHLTRPFVPVC